MYRELFFYSAVFAKVLHLQEDHRKASDKYRFLITKTNWPPRGRGNKEPSPRLPAQPTICHGMVAQALSLFSFSTAVKWAHYVDDICSRVKICLCFRTLCGFAGTFVRGRMSGELTENSWSRHRCEVLESHLFRTPLIRYGVVGFGAKSPQHNAQYRPSWEAADSSTHSSLASVISLQMKRRMESGI